MINMADRAEVSQLVAIATEARDKLLKIEANHAFRYDRNVSQAIENINQFLRENLLWLWGEGCLIVTNDIGNDENE